MEKKRERNINFSFEESELLIDLVLKYKHIIENKNMSAIIWNEKKKAWRNITEEFNVNSKYKRSMRSLKIKYEAMKMFLKKKFINNEKHNSKSSYKKLPFCAPADSSIFSFPDRDNKKVNKNTDKGAIVEEVNNNLIHNIKLETPEMEPEITISDIKLDVTPSGSDLETINNTFLGTEQILDADEDLHYGPIRTPKRLKSMGNKCYNLKETLSIMQIKSLQYDFNVRQKMDALRMKVLEVDIQIKQVELKLKERELIKND